MLYFNTVVMKNINVTNKKKIMFHHVARPFPATSTVGQE